MTKLRIGRQVLEAATLAEACRLYEQLRDDSGEGASTFPSGRWGKYRISYNGRAWLGGKPVDGLDAIAWMARCGVNVVAP